MTSLLYRIFGGQNPTSHWTEDAARTAVLTVDLTRHRFCDVAIGDPFETLSFLGPADRYYQQEAIYEYKRWGFYLVEADDRLVEVVFLIHDRPRQTAFRGKWMINGREKPITAQTRPKDIRWELGEPSQSYTEPTGERVWVYPFTGVEWEFAWLPDETLESIEMRFPLGK